MNAAQALYLLSLLVAAGCVIGGAYVLVGSGWALITAGGCSFAFSFFLRGGLRDG